MKRYMSTDPKIQTITPINHMQASIEWLKLYPIESISHLDVEAQLDYILTNHFIEVNPMNQIVAMWTEHTGGGCWVDFARLKSGKILSWNDECVCFSDTYDQWYNGDCMTVYLPEPTSFVKDTSFTWPLSFTDCLETYGGLDIIELISGQSIFIFEDTFTVCTNCLQLR